jgi:predicted RNA binding protein YcfA (HicA-like mRNA interferase family)
MANVPRISGAEAVRAFERAGFRHVRTTGSHYILKKDGHRYTLSIPIHKGKTVGVGLLRSQIDAAGLTVERFIELLNE